MKIEQFLNEKFLKERMIEVTNLQRTQNKKKSRSNCELYFGCKDGCIAFRLRFYEGRSESSDLDCLVLNDASTLVGH